MDQWKKTTLEKPSSLTNKIYQICVDTTGTRAIVNARIARWREANGTYPTRTPTPTRTPRPTRTPDYWVETFERTEGWCYMTRTNTQTNEVKKIRRKETIYWDYDDTGYERTYQINCKLVNGKEVCESNMRPELFEKWYNRFGLRHREPTFGRTPRV